MKRLCLIFLLLAFCTTAFADESQLQKATNVVNEIMGEPLGQRRALRRHVTEYSTSYTLSLLKKEIS